MVSDPTTIIELFTKEFYPIIIQIEGSSFNIGVKLDETNHDVWSKLMEIYIAEK